MEHFISDNLSTGWTSQDRVIFTGTGAWNDDKHFAPHLMLHDGVWWIFPTGLSAVTIPEDHVESIGVFSSTTLDGDSWEPATTVDGGFLFNGASCSYGTWQASAATPYAGECRDTCVVQDILNDDLWYACQNVKSGVTGVGDGARLALGMASSTTINGTYTWIDTAMKRSDGVEFRSAFVESPNIFLYKPNPPTTDGAYYVMNVLSQNGFACYTGTALNPDVGDWTLIDTWTNLKSQPGVVPSFARGHTQDLEDYLKASVVVKSYVANESWESPELIPKWYTPMVYDSQSDGPEYLKLVRFNPKTFLFTDALVPKR